MKEAMKNFLKESLIQGSNELAESALYLLRSDGIVLFENNGGAKTETIGALMSGIYQACSALGEILVAQSSGQKNFRFHYGDSEQGIMACHVGHDSESFSESFYLVCLYRSLANPGKLKHELFMLGERLCLYLQNQDSSVKDVSQDKTVLFQDISDAEVNQLFSFME